MKHAAAAPAEHLETANTGSDFDLHAILHNPETWIICAFVIFFALFGRFVLPMILKGLDSRSEKIREQLEQASRLRAQAEEMLAAYQAERAEKEKEAETIIANARHDAKALRERATADLQQSLDRRSQQALDKIARAEQDAVTFIRTQMIDVATEAVRDIVRTQLDNGKAEDPAIARAIAAIEKQIH